MLEGNSIQQAGLGTIVRIIGPVIDISFAGDELPALWSALVIHNDQHNVTIEVLEHLDRHTVRGIAMESTAGLRRYMTVEDTGAQIQVPVGKETLGAEQHARQASVPGPVGCRLTQMRADG